MCDKIRWVRFNCIITPINADPSGDTTNEVFWAERAFGLFVAILVHGWNLLFLFFLTPRIINMLESMGGTDTGFYSQHFILLGHFVGKYAIVGLPLFIGLAVWNGWAICSPKVKRRRIAWLVLALLILILMAMFVMVVLSTSETIVEMDRQNTPHSHGTP